MGTGDNAEVNGRSPDGKPITDKPQLPEPSQGNPSEVQAQRSPSPSSSDNNATEAQRALQSLRQNEDEHLWRKLYLQKSFYLVGTVLYLTTFIVVLVGVGVIDLSDAVLITMLGTTVAHVVGILAIAFHWLYPRHG